MSPGSDQSESASDRYSGCRPGWPGRGDPDTTLTSLTSTGHTNSVDCDSAWPPNIYLPLSPQYTLPTHKRSTLGPQSRLTQTSILIQYNTMSSIL